MTWGENWAKTDDLVHCYKWSKLFDNRVVKSTISFKLYWLSQHFLGKTFSRILLYPFYSLQKRQTLKFNEKSSKGSNFQICLEKDLSIKDFKKKYLKKNIPVILKGAALDWPATGKWDLNFFKDNYGDEEQPVIATTGEEIYSDKKEKKDVNYVSLKEISSQKDKYYGNFSPLVHKYKELREQLKLGRLRELQDWYSSLMLYQLFIGGEGHKTDLHSEMSSNLFIMLSGKKKWAMCSPKYAQFLDVPVSREPCFHSPVNFFKKESREQKSVHGIDYCEFILEEGDILFVPPYFWHQVYNESDSVGLAVKWHNPLAYFKSSITQSILTTFAINPPLWKLVGKGKYLNLFTDGRD
jgi:ribosomal protein L16 Arg81 hydroxylase